MMRSLYSGVTGIRNHQTRMDIIGNNIANVNTVGFKSSRVIFQDIFSQTLKPASGANGTDKGGTNPQQIGLGMQIGTIDVMHTRSTAQYTGSPLDLSISGDGYFVLSEGGQMTYTRAGNFYTDEECNLVNANGAYVQGYEVDGAGNLILDPVTGEPTLTDIYVDPDYYDVSIDSNGMVIGLDRATNDSHVLGQLVLATFANNNGLEKTGENAYRANGQLGRRRTQHAGQRRRGVDQSRHTGDVECGSDQ